MFKLFFCCIKASSNDKLDKKISSEISKPIIVQDYSMTENGQLVLAETNPNNLTTNN